MRGRGGPTLDVERQPVREAHPLMPGIAGRVGGCRTKWHCGLAGGRCRAAMACAVCKRFQRLLRLLAIIGLAGRLARRQYVYVSG